MTSKPIQIPAIARDMLEQRWAVPGVGCGHGATARASTLTAHIRKEDDHALPGL